MELDEKYLLSLDPNRLLHNFRVNAGVASSAQPLTAWEAPDSELRGHFTGEYLSACAFMYASTGDAQIKSNAEMVVAGLAECQAKLGDGYLSAFPVSFFDRLEKRQPVWAYYTIHKILAGLLDVDHYIETETDKRQGNSLTEGNPDKSGLKLGNEEKPKGKDFLTSASVKASTSALRATADKGGNGGNREGQKADGDARNGGAAAPPYHDTQALEVARKLGDWIVARNERISDSQLQSMLNVEQGGIAEALANLSAATGDPKYLAMALRFNHLRSLQPAEAQKDKLTSLHVNAEIPKFIGAAREYEVMGGEKMGTFVGGAVRLRQGYGGQAAPANNQGEELAGVPLGSFGRRWRIIGRM